jgi:ABC-type uncharacterized transport system substrate-binding protein
MRRRDFIIGLVGSATWPFTTSGQQPLMRRIGVLFYGTSTLGDQVNLAFRQGLADKGYVDGRDVEIVYHSTDRYHQLPELAANLLRQRVDIIASMGAGKPLASARATTVVPPIVYLVGAEAYGSDFTPVSASTGVNAAKRIDLLRDIAPNVKTIGYFHNPNIGTAETRMQSIETAARRAGLRLLIAYATTSSEIEPAFATLLRKEVDAFAFGTNPLFIAQTDQLVSLAARYRLPAIYPYREQVEVGGLLSYGGGISHAWRLAGAYAGSIIKGEKPMQQIVRAEMVLNLRTAKALNLEISPQVLRAFDALIG